MKDAAAGPIPNGVAGLVLVAVLDVMAILTRDKV